MPHQPAVKCTAPPHPTCDRNHSSKYVSATARLYISFSGVGALRDVKVAIAAPTWVKSDVPLDRVVAVGGGVVTPHMLQCVFFARAAIPPSSMRVSATATYLAQGSVLRCASISFPLPMSLACHVQSSQPTRGAVFKLTLDTDQAAVSKQRNH
jgi:hypothetical protein